MYIKLFYITIFGGIKMRSKAYYAITWIIGVLGFIGGVVSGEMINFVAMLYSWIGTAILCLIFGGITSILRYLEELGAGQVKTENETSS